MEKEQSHIFNKNTDNALEMKPQSPNIIISSQKNKIQNTVPNFNNVYPSQNIEIFPKDFTQIKTNHSTESLNDFSDQNHQCQKNIPIDQQEKKQIDQMQNLKNINYQHQSQPCNSQSKSRRSQKYIQTEQQIHKSHQFQIIQPQQFNIKQKDQIINFTEQNNSIMSKQNIRLININFNSKNFQIQIQEKLNLCENKDCQKIKVRKIRQEGQIDHQLKEIAEQVKFNSNQCIFKIFKTIQGDILKKSNDPLRSKIWNYMQKNSQKTAFEVLNQIIQHINQWDIKKIYEPLRKIKTIPGVNFLQNLNSIEFPHLKELNLSYCKITNIEPISWIRAPVIQKLKLSQNHIVCMKSFVKTDFKQLYSLTLDQKRTQQTFSQFNRKKFQKSKFFMMEFQKGEEQRAKLHNMLPLFKLQSQDHFQIFIQTLHLPNKLRNKFFQKFKSYQMSIIVQEPQQTSQLQFNNYDIMF